jgi:glycosyltransferase involved in cell wall biosynthesis
MAKVLMLLTNPFRPDPRVHREAKALVSAGHKVTILAWDRTGGSPPVEAVDGIKVFRFGPRSGWGATMSVLPGMTLFWLTASLGALRARPDAVHANDFDTLPLGLLVSRLTGAKLVYDAHEGYADMIRPGVPGWVADAVESAETRAMRRADLVITVNELFKDDFMVRGARESVVVANLPDAFEQIDPARESNIRKRMGSEGKTLVLYVGVLEPQRALVELVRAVKALPSDKYQLAMGGFGTLQTRLLEEARGMDNFRFLGRVEASEVLAHSAAADVLYAVYDPANSNNRKGAPNKLYEALHLRKPIIVARDTYAAKQSEAEGVGWPVTYGDVAEISAQIASAGAGRPPPVADGAAPGRWTWSHEAKRLIASYAKLTGCDG